MSESTGWRCNGLLVIGAANPEKMQAIRNDWELALNDALFLITPCAGTFLRELLKFMVQEPPKLPPGATHITFTDKAKSFECDFGPYKAKLVWDEYDLLYENQKVCNSCFRQGELILLRNCDEHKPLRKYTDTKKVVSINDALKVGRVLNKAKRLRLNVSTITITKKKRTGENNNTTSPRSDFHLNSVDLESLFSLAMMNTATARYYETCSEHLILRRHCQADFKP